MDVRRATYEAAIRLAIVLSTIAAVAALGLHAIVDVPSTALVLVVIVVGFVTSWVRTAHVARAERHAHRLAVIPLRHPVG